MDNTTRKELLYRARAAGYPGSILDVYANYDQGKDLIGEFQAEQRHQQMSGMAAQQSGLQQSAQQGGQQPQMDMQPQAVAMPAIPSPNFTPPQPPAPIGVQSQNSPMGIVSGQSGPNQGRAIFATGGFTEGDPPDWRTILNYKSATTPTPQNLVGDVRKVARPTAVAESTKVPTQKLPANFKQLKEEADLNAAADRRMAENEFVAKWDQVNGLTPRIPQPGDPDYKTQFPRVNDPAGLPSVPIFESLLMAPVALGSSGLFGAADALGGAYANSAIARTVSTGLNTAIKYPGLTPLNTLAAAGAGASIAQVPSNASNWANAKSGQDYANAAMESGVMALDFMGLGIANKIAKGSKSSYKAAQKLFSDPTLSNTKLGQSPDLNLQLLKEKGPQFEQRVLELSKLPPYNSVMDEGFDPSTVVNRLNTEIVNGKALPSLDAQLDAAEQHKLKYCPPGAACAESSNHVAQSIWNKLNPSEPYAYNENAADAWYTRDQMVKHGGEVVYDSGKQPFHKFNTDNLQIGDQVMMGPGSVTKFPDKDPATGLLKEDGVQHRATVVGKDAQGKPLILESGLGKTLIPMPLENNLFYSNSGNFGVRSIVRPRQFIGAEEKIAERLFKNGQINSPGSIEFESKFPSFKNFYDSNKIQIKHTLDLNTDETDQVFRAVMGIGAQETKLNNRLPGSKLAKAKVTIQNKLEETNLTPIVKSGVNAVKKVGNALTYFPNKDLAPFPGNARLEMEAHKLVGAGDFKNVKEAIGHLYATKYNKSPKFSTNSTVPSKGMFKQKEVSNTGKSFGLNQSNFANNEPLQLEAAMANLADITKRLRKENPDYSFEKALDLAILSWNSPSKAKSKDLVDFYYHGVGNPNPDKIKFDYLEKVKANMAKITPITNVKPKSKETIGTFVHKTGGFKEKKCYTCVGRKRRV